MRRRRFHRAVFIAAGTYNIAWGVYAAIDPQWLFRLSGMPISNSPQIFACLGMVIGLYGVLYFEVARRTEAAWLIAAVGLAGKVLGPIGLLWSIVSGEWPVSTIVLCVSKDFVWWVPFGMYLLDVWRYQHPSYSCEVQLGQRVALRGIVEAQ